MLKLRVWATTKLSDIILTASDQETDTNNHPTMSVGSTAHFVFQKGEIEKNQVEETHQNQQHVFPHYISYHSIIPKTYWSYSNGQNSKYDVIVPR
jgi:hypothetical protein